MRTLLLMNVMVLLIAACAKHVAKDWYAAGGSRADASIRMVISWNPQREIPEHNLEQARRVAEEKCRSWGYERAEAFGGIVQQCTSQSYVPFGGVVCDSMRAETEFQCLGAPAAPHTPSPQ